MLQKGKIQIVNHRKAMRILFSIILSCWFVSGFGQGGFLGKKRGVDLDVAELVLFQNIRPTAQIALSRNFSLTGSVLYGWLNTTDTIDYSELDPHIKFDQHETRFAWRVGAQFSMQLSDNYAPLGMIFKVELERFTNQRIATSPQLNAQQRADSTIASEYIFSNKGINLACFWGVSKNIGTSFYYCWGFDFGFKFGTLTSPSEYNYSEFHFNKNDSFLSDLFAVWPNTPSAGFYIRPYLMPHVRLGFMF